jgi:hypothetical protein
MKNTVFWVVMPCSLESLALHRNILLLFSESKSKPSKKPAEVSSKLRTQKTILFRKHWAVNLHIKTVIFMIKKILLFFTRILEVSRVINLMN